jgi:hypothetical protein
MRTASAYLAAAARIYSHGQQEYSFPPGVAPTLLHVVGACWYTNSSEPPSFEIGCGGPPQDTAYSLGAHMFMHVAAPEIELHPWQRVGSSEMQPMPTPDGEDAPTPPSQLTPEG